MEGTYFVGSFSVVLASYSPLLQVEEHPCLCPCRRTGSQLLASLVRQKHHTLQTRRKHSVSTEFCCLSLAELQVNWCILDWSSLAEAPEAASGAFIRDILTQECHQAYCYCRPVPGHAA
jgi:hypothetical protein